MNKLIELKTKNGSILIESSLSDKTGKMVQAGGINKKISKNLEELLKIINPLTESIITSIDNLSKKPDEVSAEFGLGISAEGNLYVVKGTVEASLTINFTWNK